MFDLANMGTLLLLSLGAIVTVILLCITVKIILNLLSLPAWHAERMSEQAKTNARLGALLDALARIEKAMAHPPEPKA
jgi:hypothetical protein